MNFAENVNSQLMELKLIELNQFLKVILRFKFIFQVDSSEFKWNELMSNE